MPRKKRHSNHIIEDRSKIILQESLPETWALHEYGPDYGIDYVIEAFQMRSNSSDSSSNYSVETLGEIIFVQLKGMNTINLETNNHTVYGRSNIEIRPLQHNKSDRTSIDTIPYTLETSELLTIQSMGSAVPVLLMVAIIETKDLFFVCLNDYIDKIILPEDPKYAVKETKTLHIPQSNNLKSNISPLLFYAKRAKYYGAFSKFNFQRNEIEILYNNIQIIVPTLEPDEPIPSNLTDSFYSMAGHFRDRIFQLDIWRDASTWGALDMCHNELNLLNLNPGETSDHRESINNLTRCLSAWRNLDNLCRIFEDIAREIYLPTSLGITLSDLNTTPNPEP